MHYEVLLDLAKLCVRNAIEHPDCPTFHRRPLLELEDELDSLYNAHLANMNPAVRLVRYGIHDE